MKREASETRREREGSEKNRDSQILGGQVVCPTLVGQSRHRPVTWRVTWRIHQQQEAWQLHLNYLAKSAPEDKIFEKGHRIMSRITSTSVDFLYFYGLINLPTICLLFLQRFLMSSLLRIVLPNMQICLEPDGPRMTRKKI